METGNFACSASISFSFVYVVLRKPINLFSSKTCTVSILLIPFYNFTRPACAHLSFVCLDTLFHVKLLKNKVCYTITRSEIHYSQQLFWNTFYLVFLILLLCRAERKNYTGKCFGECVKQIVVCVGNVGFVSEMLRMKEYRIYFTILSKSLLHNFQQQHQHLSTLLELNKTLI